jgi:uncharacterized protein YdhG (YjbR/CyaY superfamily)
MQGSKAKNIDEYIKMWPPEIQKRLSKIRKTIKEIVPAAEERISYQMPMMYLDGVLVYFAAFKNHIGFFPTSSGVSKFKSELGEYETTKGTIHLPYDKSIPFDLIRRIVLFRAEENRQRIGAKKNKRANKKVSGGENHLVRPRRSIPRIA